MHMTRGCVILESSQATPPAGVLVTYLLDLVHFEGIEKGVKEVICMVERKKYLGFRSARNRASVGWGCGR